MLSEQVKIELNKIGFEDFLEEKRYLQWSPKTLENYRYSLEIFLGFLTDNALSAKSIDHKIVMRYFTEMQDKRKWSKYTTWTQFKNLRAYFNWCVKEKIIKENPFLTVPKFKQPQQLPKALSENELVTLLDTIYKMPYKFYFTKLRDIAMVCTFLYAGVRKSELRKLTMDDVDLESGLIRIEHGKGDKYREVPIQEDELVQVLRKYFSYRTKLKKTSKWFFNGTFANRGNNDNQLSATTIDRVFKKLKVKTGIRVGAHRLRHSFATLHLDRNGDIYTLKDLMGHTDISTTCVYLSVVRRKKIETINKMVLPSAINRAQLIE